MWAGGHDLSGDSGTGIPVSLYLPKTTGKKKKRKNKSMKLQATSSFIGGTAIFFQQQQITQQVGGNSSTLQTQTQNNKTAPVTPILLACGVCHHPLMLLCQLHTPMDKMDRTLYVFGCPNSGSCGNIPGTTIRCLRSHQQKQHENVNMKTDDEKTSQTIMSNNNVDVDINPWGDDDCDDNNNDASEEVNKEEMSDNDWAMDDVVDVKEAGSKYQDDDDGGWGGDDDDDGGWGVDEPTSKTDTSSTTKFKTSRLLELEAMLSACEMESQEQQQQQQSSLNNKAAPHKNKSASIIKKTNHPIVMPLPTCLPCFELDWIDEPEGYDDMEEYTSTSATNTTTATLTENDSDSRIQNMLSKYYKSEEDTQLVETLRGLTTTSSSSAKANAAKVSADMEEDDDERVGQNLDAEDAVFCKFSKRVRREPQQVVRYAFGGQPMWSRYVHVCVTPCTVCPELTVMSWLRS
jgi:hypothetical protein